MHGMGDCLHQRAVLRQLMPDYDVYLETSWASMYHDLMADGLKLLRRPVALRTQTKNANREADYFTYRPNRVDRTLRVSYSGSQVLQTRSKTVLEAMCNVTGTDYAGADYRLPIPDKWFEGLGDLSEWRRSGKPLCVYRPLVSRTEWKGSELRSADAASYAALVHPLREAFYVISVADLIPRREWILGPEFDADLKFHEGELTFEAMAALFSLADLVFTSSGFPAILGPAVGTPTISIVGGYEHVAALSASGARFVPFLGLGPDNECSCFTSACQRRCDTHIDLESALPKLYKFLSENCLPFSDKPFVFPVVSPRADAPLATPFGSNQHDHLLQQMRRASNRTGLKA
jgi:hypothetical protein